MRRSNPDAHGNTTDIEYIYMRNLSDRGLELINNDSWWWLKRKLPFGMNWQPSEA